MTTKNLMKPLLFAMLALVLVACEPQSQQESLVQPEQAAQAPSMTEEEFQAKVQSLAKELAPDFTFEILENATYQLRDAKGSSIQFADQTYSTLVETEGPLVESSDYFLRFAEDLALNKLRLRAKDPDAIKELVLPVLTNASEVAELNRINDESGVPEEKIPYKDIAPGLAQKYVLGTDPMAPTLTYASLAEAGLKEAKVHEFAMANLRKKISFTISPSFGWLGEKGVFTVEVPEEYKRFAPTILLLPEQMKELAAKVQGTPVIAIMNYTHVEAGKAEGFTDQNWEIDFKVQMESMRTHLFGSLADIQVLVQKGKNYTAWDWSFE